MDMPAVRRTQKKGGVLKVELCCLRKSTRFCVHSGNTSGLYRHRHFEHMTTCRLFFISVL
jgi:hypothetical protein